MRQLVLIAISMLVAACGGSSSSTTPPADPPDPPVGQPGPPADPPAPPADPPAPPRQPGSIAVSRSGSEVVASTINGGTQNVLITFSAEDERVVDELAVTQGLSELPAGWSGPASFTCSNVTVGNACALSLTYAPAVVGEGTLTLGYEYASAGAAAVSGTLEIDYAATANNNVLTTVTPMGAILGVVADGHQSVRITFTSDDGNLARNLSVTSDLNALPAGWSSEADAFDCTEVSTGSGCQLVLEYAPLVYGDGTLELGYSYVDNSGAAKVGTVALPYLARVHNTVVATPSQALPFDVPVGATQTLTLTFTTDDGHPMRWVEVLTDLQNDLPAGWNGPQSLRCENVATGNGCQLTLQYAPTSQANSSFFLQFGWEDGAGRENQASLPIAFNALTHNSVIGTSNPNGQIASMVGGSQAVRVTFTTDDSITASDFALDTDLTSLPAGWSTASSSLQCPLVHSGGTCYVDLAYAPNAVTAGTLTLNYSYTNNAGTARTGTVNLPYVATSDNNIAVAVSPATPFVRRQGDDLDFTLTFTSDDGEPVTGFTTTTVLNTIPNLSSSGQTSKTCATVSTGSGCTLSLRFTPLATRSGTISIGYSYTNNAGLSKTGTVNLPFESWPPLAYIGSNTSITRCEYSVVTGASTCGTSVSLTNSTDIEFVLSGSTARAYITDPNNNMVVLCSVQPNGAFTACRLVASTPQPYALAIFNNRIYFSSSHPIVSIYTCSINADGTLNGCGQEAFALSGITSMVSTFGGLLAVDSAGNRILRCTVSNATTGALSCANLVTGLSTPYGITQWGGNVYWTERGTNRVRACTLDDSGGSYVLTDCVDNAIGFTDLRGISLSASRALVTTGGKVAFCEVTGIGAQENKVLSNCRDSGASDVGQANTVDRF